MTTDAENEFLRDQEADGALFGIDDDGELVSYEGDTDELESIPDPGGFPGDGEDQAGFY